MKQGDANYVDKYQGILIEFDSTHPNGEPREKERHHNRCKGCMRYIMSCKNHNV